ncbi:hypothetical protein BDV59DRAFT_50867 [Aspergillus ambiguus]|uniref:uncharacterized protein n=1 Tax=Aspergillus ambiguus TaxID=176160 RepID=UPI003CCDEBDE
MSFLLLLQSPGGSHGPQWNCHRPKSSCRVVAPNFTEQASCKKPGLHFCRQQRLGGSSDGFLGAAVISFARWSTAGAADTVTIPLRHVICLLLSSVEGHRLLLVSKLKSQMRPFPPGEESLGPGAILEGARHRRSWANQDASKSPGGSCGLHRPPSAREIDDGTIPWIQPSKRRKVGMGHKKNNRPP